MTKRSVLAACAVVSLCGTSYGWSLLLFGQPSEEQPGGQIIQKDVTPSSGLIRFAEVETSSSSYVSEFTGDFGLVTGTAAAWSTRRADINNSSWFGGDSTGPDGAYTSGSVLSNRPAWNAGYGSNATYTGQGAGGPTWVGSGDGDDLVSSIDPGELGWVFVFDLEPSQGNSGMPSNVSLLGGPSIMDGLNYDWSESVFVGRMTLTDPGAHLTGDFFVRTRDERGPYDGWELDLNGTPSYDLKFVQVRDGNSINLFIVEVPAPGALGAVGLAGVIAGRRRRR